MYTYFNNVWRSEWWTVIAWSNETVGLWFWLSMLYCGRKWITCTTPTAYSRKELETVLNLCRKTLGYIVCITTIPYGHATTVHHVNLFWNSCMYLFFVSITTSSYNPSSTTGLSSLLFPGLVFLLRWAGLFGRGGGALPLSGAGGGTLLGLGRIGGFLLRAEMSGLGGGRGFGTGLLIMYPLIYLECNKACNRDFWFNGIG